MAEQYWRLRRARRLEAELLSSDNIVLSHLTAIQRMMSSAERGFHKALTALRQLQKDRGFVPANSVGAPAGIDQTEPHPTEPRLEGAVQLSADSCALIAPAGFVSQTFPEPALQHSA
jgi:hypothetical protein